jgi:hypothetical protein
MNIRSRAAEVRSWPRCRRELPVSRTRLPTGIPDYAQKVEPKLEPIAFWGKNSY